MEIYRDINNFNGIYKVSNYGNVMSFSKYSKNGKILKKEKTNRGYLRVNLSRKKYSIHRLVALYFLGVPKEGMVVNHKDGNKENNCISNLEWVTQKENIKHSFKNGMSKIEKGALNKLSFNILKIDKNTDIVLESIVGIRDYCSLNKFDRRCIQRAINGEYKTAYGYKWALS
jgi:hypothetical protein